MFRLMRSLTPSDATATAVAADAIPEGEEQSLHDEILIRLRDHIVEGNIPDGGRIPERQLCEMLGISRTPLREALKVLAAEGLIELLPNRGARVRQLSERDLGELFDIMGGLESLAGRLACENISDGEIAEIERLHYEMYGFYLHRDMHGYFRVNQLIHQKIVEASRNTTLLGAYANFAGRIRRVRYRAQVEEERRVGEYWRDRPAASQEQSTGDATLQRLLARERYSIPNGASTQLTSPMRPAESSGQHGWLTSALGVLALVVALVAGVAVMAARRAKSSQRAGQTA